MTVAVQPTLDFSRRLTTLERRYRDWRQSPAGQEVYPLFKSFAQQMLHRRRKFGMKALAERVRWEISLNTKRDPHELKINNSLIAYAARELLQDLPELKDLIEVRRVKEER